VFSFLEGNTITAILAFAAVFLGVLSLVLGAELLRGWVTQRKVRSRLRPVRQRTAARPGRRSRRC